MTWTRDYSFLRRKTVVREAEDATTVVERFFSVKDACVDKGHQHLESLKPCSTSEWSSLSGDPKSEIRGLDPATGRLF